MKIRNILVFIGALIWSGFILKAQQLPTFSQYIMNGHMVNPSLTGMDGYSTASVTVREQWMGLKGGPSTYVASFQTNLLKDSYISRFLKVRRKASRPTKPSRVGLGGSIFNDNNGIIRRTGLKLDYAYHIPLRSRIAGGDDFSFGLSMITYQHVLRTDLLNGDYSDDPYLNNYDKSVFITDFSFGANYTTEKYYVGFAMTNILRGGLIYANEYKNKRGEVGHYFLTGGMSFDLNKDWTLKPSAFIKLSDNISKSAQADITARMFYKDDYWGGLSYRTGDAVILMFGMKYSQFYIANSFDFILSDIRNKSFGSYEITVAVKFGESPRRFRWINAI